jgi:hypothetical protein
MDSIRTVRVLVMVLLAACVLGFLGSCSSDTTTEPAVSEEEAAMAIMGIPYAETTQPKTKQPGMSLARAAIMIDFEAVPSSDNLYGTPNNPASVLTNEFQAEGVVYGRNGMSAGVAVLEIPFSFAPSSGTKVVVGLDRDGTIPESTVGAAIGDIYLTFVVPGQTTPAATDFVSFTLGDAGGDLDEFEIRCYDLHNVLIDSQAASGNARFTFSVAEPGIHRIEVDFLGDGGYGLDDLSFGIPVGDPNGDDDGSGKDRGGKDGDSGSGKGDDGGSGKNSNGQKTRHDRQ